VAFYSTSSDLVDSDGNANPDVFLADTRSGDVTRISETPGGGTPNGQSYAHGVSISKSGRHAVFYSQASDLAEDDANGKWDVFLHDRVRGTTALVSRNPAGAPANGDSMHPSLSPNGRFVAYHSAATDLVEGETGTNSEVYVFDTRSGTTTKASPGLSGADAAGGSLDPVVSDNGRWVAFFSYAGNLVPDDTNGRSDVFLFDRKTGALRLLSVREDGTRGDGYSYTPAMSANGKSLVFFTEASNLVAGDANGSATDVVHVDVKTGALTLLSADAAGAGGDGSSYVYPAGLSSGGRRVVFFSAATNLVAADANGRYDVFVARLK
jgi:Tol biopolymer transport system component